MKNETKELIKELMDYAEYLAGMMREPYTKSCDLSKRELLDLAIKIHELEYRKNQTDTLDGIYSELRELNEYQRMRT